MDNDADCRAADSGTGSVRGTHYARALPQRPAGLRDRDEREMSVEQTVFFFFPSSVPFQCLVKLADTKRAQGGDGLQVQRGAIINVTPSATELPAPLPPVSPSPPAPLPSA